MKKFFILITTALLVFACNPSPDQEPVTEPIQRTVIIYMSGENDLDSRGFLNTDLNEIIAGSKDIPQHNRLVAFVDRSSYSQKPYIVEINNCVCDTIQTYQSDFYASDPDRFVEVISTIESKFPAKEYGLVLWGHATGWLITADSVAQSPLKATAAGRHKAYGMDLGNNQSSGFGERWMNITQMARAMKQLPHFKFIFADCCCMMCAEVAYELRNATDFLIGSPAEIPGDGAPYHIWIKNLFLRTDDFYCNLIDDYYNYYSEEYKTSIYTSDPTVNYLSGHSVPLTVVDMRYMEQLASITKELLQSPDSFHTDSVAFYFCLDYPVMYDMGGLMESICTPQAYSKWKQVLNKAVPYRLFSAKWMTMYPTLEDYQRKNKFHFNEDNYAGLSMFVPLAAYNFSRFYKYNETIPSMQWFNAIGWNRFWEY